MSAVFMNRSMLLLLAVLPLLILLFVLASAMRHKALARLVQAPLSTRLLDPALVGRRRLAAACLLAAVALTVLGLARPAWDTESVENPSTGRDLVFILDISQSMLAEDQPPCRLVCAKNSILQCVDEVTSARVGLVVFAGSTAIRCPLTRDEGFFRSTLEDVAPNSVPVGGTRIGDAIIRTVEKVLTGEDAEHRDVILITDGENQEPVGTNALSRLADSGARLIVIGLGSDSVPSEIPIRNEDSGKVEPLVYRDRIVHTTQRSDTLAQLAEAVPGAIYINVGTHPLNLADVYRAHIDATLRESAETVSLERPQEQYWRFLLAAVIFLCVPFLPLRWPEAVRKLRKETVALLMFLLLMSVAPSGWAAGRNRMFDEGVAAYHDGDFEGAIERFSAAQQKASDPIIDYNLGTAHYRLGDMPNALVFFSRAAEAATAEPLSVDARYNMGNSMFMMAFGDDSAGKEDTMQLLRQSIDAYESVLRSQPEHENALYNMGVVRQVLEGIKDSGDQESDEQDGTESRDVGEDEESTKQSESSSQDAGNMQGQQDEGEDEQPAPNLTPEEVLEEEQENKLTRSRKTHAAFSKTKKNW